MLSEITLKNFKCFKNNTKIPVKRINLFTGINGGGKSTVLQTLLMMKQSPEVRKNTHQIFFNGSCVELGSFRDVKNSSLSHSEAIEFAYKFKEEDDHVNIHYVFRADENDGMLADIEKMNINIRYNNKEFKYPLEKKMYESENSVETYYEVTVPRQADLIEEYGSKIITLENMSLSKDYRELFIEDEHLDFIHRNIDFTKTHYISADRIGPKDFYLRQNLADFPTVGSKGEFTADILSRKKNEPVYDFLSVDQDAPQTVLDQTEAWIGIVFGEGKIRIKPLEANIIIMQMSSQNFGRSRNLLYKPVNVGFGYSYALPIIVSGLIAEEGEILIIENPEAHLHPSAQSQLSKFLAKVSACGVQVFIESHSDHILNGLRVAVLDEVIKPDELNIIYFQRDESHQFIEIPVRKGGSIEDWPDGFCDQSDKDFKRLFGF